MAKINKVVGTIYNYTHVFVGAGAVVTSFLDTQQLPPKFAAGVVIASQTLKVVSDYLTKAKTVAPIAEKLAEVAVKQVEQAIHPAVAVVPAAPLEPAAPTPVQATTGYVQAQPVEPAVPGQASIAS